jgi:hypothetical protein
MQPHDPQSGPDQIGSDEDKQSPRPLQLQLLAAYHRRLSCRSPLQSAIK